MKVIRNDKKIVKYDDYFKSYIRYTVCRETGGGHFEKWLSQP